MTGTYNYYIIVISHLTAVLAIGCKWRRRDIALIISETKVLEKCQSLVLSLTHLYDVRLRMIVIAQEVENTMSHDTIKLTGESRAVRLTVCKDRIQTYDNISRQSVRLTIHGSRRFIVRSIESYNVSIIIMTQKLSVDIQDIGVRRKEVVY